MARPPGTSGAGDLTSGPNSYPDLRLTNNLPADYAASMSAIDDVLAKMTVLGSRDLVMSSCVQQESNLTAAGIEATIREICRRAAERQVTVYLRVYPGRGPANLAEALQTIKRIGAANLRLAPSTAQWLSSAAAAQGIGAELRGAIGLWMVGQPAFDLQGRPWSVHRPIAEITNRQPLTQLLTSAPAAPIVFDVLYENHDAEYLDASLVETLLPRPERQATGDPLSRAKP